MQVIDREELRKPGEAYRTCCRLAAMAGEARPEFVNWGKVYATPDGMFRIVCELRPRRGRGGPMIAFVEKVM